MQQIQIYCCFIFCLCSSISLAQNASQIAYPVIFRGDTLYSIQNNIGAFSAEQRASAAQKNIQQLAKLPLIAFDSLELINHTASSDVVYQFKVITSVIAEDATAVNTTMEFLAMQYKTDIRQALIDDFNDTSIGKVGRDIAFFLLALLVFLLVFTAVNRTFDYFRRNLRQLQRNIFFRDNRLLKFFSAITPETERNLLLFLLRMLRFTTLGTFLYFYLPFLFSQISYTRGFGEQLMGYVLRPLQFLATSFVSFLPNFLFITIIILAVRYLIKGLSYLTQQVRTERIKLNGFFPDWATPTFNLFRVLIIIFTLVIIFPYLPGSGSDAFQGISVFIGLLLSLGSAGIISNVLSGVILTYMRPFKVGDRVKINDATGDVISKNLLVTRLKTLKNEEITIPNGSLLGSGVVNYSALAEEQGLILHTGITIGYDTPWQQVHELLISAAIRTELIEKEPTPFVLQKSLDDWYVAYELNVYTKESHKTSKIYSDLHANIQDVFNEAGLEIMSSHYMAVRDGNTMAVPSNYLPNDYKTPTVRVDVKNKAKQA